MMKRRVYYPPHPYYKSDRKFSEFMAPYVFANGKGIEPPYQYNSSAYEDEVKTVAITIASYKSIEKTALQQSVMLPLRLTHHISFLIIGMACSGKRIQESNNYLD
jgi:hypothetical protein